MPALRPVPPGLNGTNAEANDRGYEAEKEEKSRANGIWIRIGPEAERVEDKDEEERSPAEQRELAGNSDVAIREECVHVSSRAHSRAESRPPLLIIVYVTIPTEQFREADPESFTDLFLSIANPAASELQVELHGQKDLAL